MTYDTVSTFYYKINIISHNYHVMAADISVEWAMDNWVEINSTVVCGSWINTKYKL